MRTGCLTNFLGGGREGRKRRETGVKINLIEAAVEIGGNGGVIRRNPISARVI